VKNVRLTSKSARSTSKALKAALALFSRQGFRATTMRQIARRSGLSVGNLYHHFGNKEAIYTRLIEQYWERLSDPGLRLNKVFFSNRFPDDLEEMAEAIEEIVDGNSAHILLIYIDVIEFKGKHIKEFYATMPARFTDAYGERCEQLKRDGKVGDVDPMVAVMVAARWFFYFHTIEKCFGVPMHFGMSPQKAVDEFIRLLRYGLIPRSENTKEDAIAGP
jgi:AcrR family transcriptional regulator